MSRIDEIYNRLDEIKNTIQKAEGESSLWALVGSLEREQSRLINELSNLQARELPVSNSSLMDFWSIIVYNQDELPVSIGIFYNEDEFKEQMELLAVEEVRYKAQKGLDESINGCWFILDLE